MPGTGPAAYWSEVATRARSRARGSEVAGDDTVYYRYKRQLFLERFLPALPAEGKRVLEVGCGPGGNLRQLVSRSPSLLMGCDVAPAMVELARDSLADTDVDVRITDGATLPFADSAFDTSFTVTVLQHNPASHVTSLAAEMARVSKSSIYLIEDTFAIDGEGDEEGRFAYGNIFPRSIYRLASFFLPYGFEVVSSTRLRTRVSRRANDILARMLSPGSHFEGEPYPKAYWIAGRLSLPVTRIADRFVRSPQGELTMLHLARGQARPLPETMEVETADGSR